MPLEETHQRIGDKKADEKATARPHDDAESADTARKDGQANRADQRVADEHDGGLARGQDECRETHDEGLHRQRCHEGDGNGDIGTHADQRDAESHPRGIPNGEKTIIVRCHNKNAFFLYLRHRRMMMSSSSSSPACPVFSR